MFWEGGMPIDTQTIDLYMMNETTMLYDIFVGTYMTDSLGFVQASVIKGGFTWKINGKLPISPADTYIQWHDYPKHQDFTFALKVKRGIIIIVFFVIIVLLEEEAMITISIFSF